MPAPNPNHLQDPARIVPGRVPPNARELEEALLSQCMMREEALDQAVELGLQPGHMYADEHRWIFDAMLALRSEMGMVVEVLTVADYLRRNGRIDQVGGTPKLAQLIEAPLEGERRIELFCRTIIDRFRERQAISIQQESIARLYVPGGAPTQELLNELDEKLYEVVHAQNQELAYEGAGDVAGHALTDMADRLRRGESLMGVTTGFRDVDEITTGYHPENVFVVAARPGMGKSSWLISSVLLATAPPKQEEELPEAVYVHSLEMPKIEVALNMVCSLAGVEFVKLRKNLVTQPEWTRLIKAAVELKARPIFIDDKPAVTVSEVRGNVRKIKREIARGKIKAKRLAIVGVDYLQLMRGEQGQGREREISSLTQGLKNLAKIEKVCVLELAQLNRDSEKRAGSQGRGKRPQLSDLRESGSIEQDADIIGFIYRERYYDKEASDESELIFEKNRNGPTHTARLAFHGATKTFKSLARGYEEMGDFADEGSRAAPGYWQDGYEEEKDYES